MVDLEKLLHFSKKLTLLYVEDNQDTREMTQILLGEYFDKIILAVDGEDGYEKYLNNKVDLIITDINMPKLDGLSFARKVKEQDSEIPILIFSAYNDNENFMEAIKIGVDGYLVKPLDIEQMNQTLYKAIQLVKHQHDSKAYQKSLEEEVEQKDNIIIEQSRLAAMGEMIDIIAHQWKQPLNTIIMHASLIEAYLQEGNLPQKELEEFLENIDTKVNYLLETLQEFRSFFRPNTTLGSISLRESIKSSLLLLKDDLIAHSVEIDIECSEECHIKAYPNDIKQLLINTITNAKEAMVEQKIPSTQRRVMIRCKKEDTKVVLEIADSGAGIPEEMLEDIFTMNFTTKSQNGGTGIGLYMCALICEKYNASIKAYNDNGAVIRIEFDEKN